MIIAFRHGRAAHARVLWRRGEPLEAVAERAAKRMFGPRHRVQAVDYLGREESGFDAYVAHVLRGGAAKCTITGRARASPDESGG